jgi:predicted type IV restriction endonuclease
VSVDIRRPLKKLLPFLIQAQKDNLNEANTVLRLVKMFEDVLGWDGMSEISRESPLKNKYVDIVLKKDGVIKLLVEAKAAGEKLRDRYVEQAELYASENNYHWVVLTNGVVWNLYHLTFDEGINYEKAFSVDLADEAQFDANAERLALLHSQAFKKEELEAFWVRNVAMNAACLGKILFDEKVLSLIRREIHRSKEVLIDIEDLATALHDLLSVEAREKIGPPKIRHRVRRGRAKNLRPDEPAEDAALHLIRADGTNAAAEETEEIDQIDEVKPAS